MHRLGVEFAGEFDDLGRAYILAAKVERGTLDEVLIGPGLSGHVGNPVDERVILKVGHPG